MKVKKLFAFIRERHSIYERRRAGELKPWTEDKILQSYRFCNVYRELDAVTVWVRENWREPNADDPDLWFAMVIVRLLNYPPSLTALKFPVPWNAKQFQKTLRARKEFGDQVFNGAYMIHADSKPGWLKTDYLAQKILNPLWKDREVIRPRKDDSLASFFARLTQYRDMGSFIAGQVIADTKQQGVLKKAEDWWTWAAPGPGSMRGLNRICKHELKESWKDGQVNHWLPTLQVLQTKLDPLLREAGMPRMCAQDVQNCCCEWDKYERTRLGEGRPKQRYNGLA